MTAYEEKLYFDPKSVANHVVNFNALHNALNLSSGMIV